MKVRAKKYLGQHFLNDLNIARKIAEATTRHEGYDFLLEIGPGTGALSQFLVQQKWKKLVLMDLDEESINFLVKKYSHHKFVDIVHQDFLRTNLREIFKQPFGLIGNFPYNISSQIFFKILENKELIPEVVGMLQKEVAERICAAEGSKTYGILSVLIGAFYERELLFKVSNQVFTPKPKVESAVIRIKRRENFKLDCDETLFLRIVKQSFQNRRKTLRNALKPINLPLELVKEDLFGFRAEQLSIPQFIDLTKKIEAIGRS